MGGRSPPPPPRIDRSGERSAFVTAQNAQRQQQAQSYNERVNTFNQQLQNYLTGAASTRTRASQLGILDDEMFSGLENEINSARSSLMGFDFTETQPDFQSVVNSGISDDFSGGAVTLNVPTLQRPNTSARNAGLADLQAALDSLNTIRGQRRAEEERVRGQVASANAMLGGLNTQLNNIGLRDFQTQRGQLANSIGQARSSITGFSSPILSEFMTNDVAGLNTGLTNLDTAFSGLNQRLTNEQNRINSFRNQLLGDASALTGRLRNASIADTALKSEAEAQIEALRGQARGFTSELATDFGQPLADLESAQARINTLRQQRAAEEERIRSAIAQGRSELGSIETGVTSADTFNLNALNSLAQRIAQLRQGAQSFTTPLTADFSPLLTQADGLTEHLNNLRGQRQTALDQLRAQATGLTSGLGDIPLQNESAIQDLRRRAVGFQNQLGQFIGNDLADERSAIGDVVTQFDNRLQQLSQRRSDIETRARQLQTAIQNGTYFQLSDLTPQQQQLAQLRAEQELFAATQALDEIDQITQFMNNQTSRIQRDTAAREAALRAEQQGLLGTEQGTRNVSAGSLSEAEILALLSGIRRDREQVGNPNVTPTSGFGALVA